jgi:hypothetical protein
LQHRADVQRYLADREAVAGEVRGRIDAHQGDLAELRTRLLARRDR